MAEGQRIGLLEAISFGLDPRFGISGLRLMPEISKIKDVDLLRTIQDGLRRAQTPEECGHCTKKDGMLSSQRQDQADTEATSPTLKCLIGKVMINA